jgi:hypothetical protein
MEEDEDAGRDQDAGQQTEGQYELADDRPDEFNLLPAIQPRVAAAMMKTGSIRYHAAKAQVVEQMGLRASDSKDVRIWDDARENPLCYSLVNLGSGGALVSIAASHSDAALRSKALDEHLTKTVGLKTSNALTWDDVALDGRGVFGETILHVAFLRKNRELVAFLVERYSQKAGRLHATKKFLDAAYTHELYKGPPLLRFVALECALKSAVWPWDTVGPRVSGEVCMHIAIVDNDLEHVKLLAEHGAHPRPPAASYPCLASRCVR